MTDPHGPEPATDDASKTALGASVRTYQILVAVLFVALLGAWALFDRIYDRQDRLVASLAARLAAADAQHAAEARPAAPKDGPAAHISVVDVGARFAELSRQFADAADYSDPYYRSANASVHMHIMAEEQTCPLHIHRRTHEATVIVDGLAEVTHVFPKDGALVTRTGTFGPGALIASPPFCGHQWVNRSATAKLGNLVFGFPRFDGNLYVKSDDAKLRKGEAPVLYDPTEDLAALASGAAPSQEKPLAILEGRMRVLLVKASARLEPRPAHPIILYVLRGAGSLDNGGVHPIRERHLAVIDGGPAVTLQAEKPLAALRFDPEG